jgi:probable HAF family extracellular repeat protein
MSRRNRLRAVRRAAKIGLGLLALLWAGRALATPFVFTPIDVPGATETIARGINDLGQIVGSFRDASGDLHGFLQTGGSYVQLDYSDPFIRDHDTEAYGINDHGEIVGTVRDELGELTAFLLSGGTYSAIRLHGEVASGINDAGQIVGSAIATSDQPFFRFGWLRSHGTFTTFFGAELPPRPPPPFDRYSITLNGINDAGEIVGLSNDPSLPEAFLLKDGMFLPLDVPGDPRAINDSGAIVGSFRGGDFVDHGYVLSDGNLVTLDFPGASQTIAYGINDSGSIVGEYTAGGVRHGFLATPIPIPEPSTAALLGLGTIVLASLGRSRAWRSARRGADLG